MRYLICFLILVLGGVCPVVGESDLTPTSDDTAASISVVGKTVKYGGARDGSGHQRREMFCQDGRWGMFGGRVATYGTYEISGSSVCVTRDDGSKLCRRFYKGEVSSFAALESGDGWAPEGEVRIYPLSGCF